MLYLDRQDCGLPHAELEPLTSGTDLTTTYAGQLIAAPNGGQFQAVQQQIAREHSIALSQSEYDWTPTASVQIFLVLVAVLAVPCFIWRLLMRLGSAPPGRARRRRPQGSMRSCFPLVSVGGKHIPRSAIRFMQF
jgi:hypothetical protein